MAGVFVLSILSLSHFDYHILIMQNKYLYLKKIIDMAIRQDKPTNPFYTTITIPNGYFCGREKETTEIIGLIESGNNIVLTAPRRTGKSTLLKHILLQTDISTRYNTIYVDILGTANADDFIRAFQNAILEQPFARVLKSKEMIKDVFLHPNFQMKNIDPALGISLPKIGFNPTGKIEVTIGRLFELLENTNKPNIVVFDEFQQIEEYQEKMAAILRAHIQQCNNTKFIYSGSEQHMLDTMFNTANEPFFKSARPMNLKPLSLETYSDFCKKCFRQYGKDITDDAIELVYCLFEGSTYHMQDTMNELFFMISPGEIANKEHVLQAIDLSLERREQDFREILNRYPNPKERKVLFCIANEGIATKILSSEIINKYELDNPSSIQNALNNLINRDKRKNSRAKVELGIVTEFVPNCYKLKDKYFELWLVREIPTFDYKINNAKEIYEHAQKMFNDATKIQLPKYFKNL